MREWIYSNSQHRLVSFDEEVGTASFEPMYAENVLQYLLAGSLPYYAGEEDTYARWNPDLDYNPSMPRDDPRQPLNKVRPLEVNDYLHRRGDWVPATYAGILPIFADEIGFRVESKQRDDNVIVAVAGSITTDWMRQYMDEMPEMIISDEVADALYEQCGGDTDAYEAAYDKLQDKLVGQIVSKARTDTRLQEMVNEAFDEDRFGEAIQDRLDDCMADYIREVAKQLTEQHEEPNSER